MGARGSKVLQKQGCVLDSSISNGVHLPFNLRWVGASGRTEAVSYGDTTPPPRPERPETPTGLTAVGFVGGAGRGGFYIQHSLLYPPYPSPL